MQFAIANVAAATNSLSDCKLSGQIFAEDFVAVAGEER
jgi:hypothetical protein